MLQIIMFTANEGNEEAFIFVDAVRESRTILRGVDASEEHHLTRTKLSDIFTTSQKSATERVAQDTFL